MKTSSSSFLCCLSLRGLSDYRENDFNLILFWRGKITVGLYCQTSWVDNDKPFKTDVKYTTTYYRNDVNSNPTTTAQCYQADVFSPPQLSHLCMCLYIYALKNNFLMHFFNRNYSSIYFTICRVFYARKDDDYKGEGDLHYIWLWISQNYLSVEDHLCSPGCIIYLSSQKAADTNITNTRLWVSITGINSIWPGWILFPSLAGPMCQCKFWTQSEEKR